VIKRHSNEKLHAGPGEFIGQQLIDISESK